MANRNIDTTIRKPRRAKGTPLFYQRNLFAIAGLAFGGVCWYLYELWPQAQKLKQSVRDGKFKYSPEVQQHILSMQLSNQDPAVADLIRKFREKQIEQENESRPQPWYSKVLSSKPEFQPESVSKYFTRNLTQTLENNAEASTSLYSNNLTEIKQIIRDDGDDFKTPKPVKKLAKIFTELPKAKRKYAKKGRPPKNSVQNVVEDMFKGADVNGEHLQMVVALSKSEQEARGDAPKHIDEDFPVCQNTQEVRETARKTLEQYGFRSSRNDSPNVDFSRNVKPSKRKKKSRYHNITPILLLRTEEDRQRLINEKVSSILKESELTESVHSQILKGNQCSRGKMFDLNSAPLEELSTGRFYVEKLNLPRSEHVFGSLLRRWEDIPGRDLSPVRDTELKKQASQGNLEICQQSHEKKMQHNKEFFQQEILLEAQPSGTCDSSQQELPVISNLLQQPKSGIGRMSFSESEKLQASQEKLAICEKSHGNEMQHNEEFSQQETTSIPQILLEAQPSGTCDFSQHELPVKSNLLQQPKIGIGGRSFSELEKLEASQEKLAICQQSHGKEMQHNEEFFQQETSSIPQILLEAQPTGTEDSSLLELLLKSNLLQQPKSGIGGRSFSELEKLQASQEKLPICQQSHEKEMQHKEEFFEQETSSIPQILLEAQPTGTEDSSLLELPVKSNILQLPRTGFGMRSISPDLFDSDEDIHNEVTDEVFVAPSQTDCEVSGPNTNNSSQTIGKCATNTNDGYENAATMGIDNEATNFSDVYHDGKLTLKSASLMGDLNSSILDDQDGNSDCEIVEVNNICHEELLSRKYLTVDLTLSSDNESSEEETHEVLSLSGVNPRKRRSFEVDSIEKVEASVRKLLESSGSSDEEEEERRNDVRKYSNKEEEATVKNAGKFSNTRNFNDACLSSSDEEVETFRNACKYSKSGKFKEACVISNEGGSRFDACKSSGDKEIAILKDTWRSKFSKTGKLNDEEVMSEDAFHAKLRKVSCVEEEGTFKCSNYDAEGKVKKLNFQERDDLSSCGEMNCSEIIANLNTDETSIRSDAHKHSEINVDGEEDLAWRYLNAEGRSKTGKVIFDEVNTTINNLESCNEQHTPYRPELTSRSPPDSSMYFESTFYNSDLNSFNVTRHVQDLLNDYDTSFLNDGNAFIPEQAVIDLSQESDEHESDRSSSSNAQNVARSLEQSNNFNFDVQKSSSSSSDDDDFDVRRPSKGSGSVMDSNEGGWYTFSERQTGIRAPSSDDGGKTISKEGRYMRESEEIKSCSQKNERVLSVLDENSLKASDRREKAMEAIHLIDLSSDDENSQYATKSKGSSLNRRKLEQVSSSDEDSSDPRPSQGSFLQYKTRFAPPKQHVSTDHNFVKQASSLEGDSSDESDLEVSDSDVQVLLSTRKMAQKSKPMKNEKCQQRKRRQRLASPNDFFRADKSTLKQHRSIYLKMRSASSPKNKTANFAASSPPMNFNKTNASSIESTIKNGLDPTQASPLLEIDLTDCNEIDDFDLIVESTSKSEQFRPNSINFNKIIESTLKQYDSIQLKGPKKHNSLESTSDSVKSILKELDSCVPTSKEKLQKHDSVESIFDGSLKRHDSSKLTLKKHDSFESPRKKFDSTTEKLDSMNPLEARYLTSESTSRKHEESPDFNETTEKHDSGLKEPVSLDLSDTIESPLKNYESAFSNNECYFRDVNETSDSMLERNGSIKSPLRNYEHYSKDVNGTSESASKKSFSIDLNDANGSPLMGYESPLKSYESRLHNFEPLLKNFQSPLDNGEAVQESKLKKHNSMRSLDSAASQEGGSICISDEELNYSSAFHTPAKTAARKFEVSDSEDEEQNVAEQCAGDDTEVDLDVLLKRFQVENARKEQYFRDHNIVFDKKRCDQSEDQSWLNETHVQESLPDEVMSYAVTNHPNVTNLPSTSHNEPDDLTFPSSPIKKLVHHRLTGNNPPNLFEDTFAHLLKQPAVIAALDECNREPQVQSETSTPNLSTRCGRASGTGYETPNGTAILKTAQVTPMPDFESMGTPAIVKELSRFGLKKLKRQRGVQMLKYIYEFTHPLVDQGNGGDGDEDDSRVVKRRRLVLDGGDQEGCPVTDMHDDGNPPSRVDCVDVNFRETEEDMIFEKKRSKQIHSCQLPLHIAWHNLLAANPDIRENVLLYEPLQVEVLYGILKEQGFNYNIQDLISFLDKKCVTIRMNQN